VDPNDSSQQIGETGSEVAVDSATTLELDVTYMFSSHFGLEVIAATTKHDLAAAGGALNGANLGSVKVLPPTATLQWHPAPGGLMNFYLGLGINYTLFYSYDLSDDLAGLGVTDVGFDNSFGLAGDVGLNINLGKKLHLNADVKYIQITTTADIKTADGTLDKVDVDINPWVFGLGIGYRF
jgi:outer membrane protein